MLPDKIFCVKCGNLIDITQVADKETLKKAASAGYVGVGRFVCKCGAVGIILCRPMPESPSFTVTFDIYNVTNKGG